VGAHLRREPDRQPARGDTLSFASGNQQVLALELDPTTGDLPFGYTVEADFFMNGDRVAPYGNPDDYVLLGHPDQDSGVFLFPTKLRTLPQQGRSVQPVNAAISVDLAAADGNLFVASLDNINGTYRTRVTAFSPGFSPVFDSSICNGRIATECPGGCCPCDSTYAVAVQPTNDGGVFVVSGATQGPSQTFRSVVMVSRFSPTGGLVWNREYNTSKFHASPTAAVVSPDRKELVIVGQALPNSPGRADPLWMKVDESGELRHHPGRRQPGAAAELCADGDQQQRRPQHHVHQRGPARCTGVRSHSVVVVDVDVVVASRSRAPALAMRTPGRHCASSALKGGLRPGIDAGAPRHVDGRGQRSGRGAWTGLGDPPESGPSHRRASLVPPRNRRPPHRAPATSAARGPSGDTHS